MEGQRRVLAMKMEKLKTQNPDGFCRKVMTDDQVEQLRKQIAVYAVICEQLVDMHKAFTAQQDLSGMKMGSVYGDLMASGGSKVTARQRWTPTSLQLEILERIYDEANGTPGKHRVKEITIELSQHGQVTETNVYNWFQNRRARSKRKQSVPARNITESDLEPEVISPKDKKTKPEDMYFQSPDSGYENLKW
ncbi:putative transcription factor Homobox-WOX family [Rosa chinensis]|uniref:Putative transcription factor Homobox-WOX family n=1 Tax=Rosa chinensis TaxID=74649 RepID=A0A2P6PBJ9_ROSCH|nr:WUSCHEL-related homeobox 8 [Rosa chinensis]XP_040366082.1 WUSCHEL-related homeobox 8 [Rosa chinensis]PRQ19301.1 putative transcription factor Homobox-WOX family [Rosa chinensis]